MSVSAALQKLAFDTLIADAGVGALVGDRIYDGVPKDAGFPYVSFGPTDVVPDDAECFDARMETVQIDVWPREHARLRVSKAICDAIKAALHDLSGTLEAGALQSCRVTRMQVMPDPDGITAHGIVAVQAMVQESGLG